MLAIAGARERKPLGSKEADEAWGEESDDRLMARVAGGDQAAYRVLVERHIDRMCGLANRMLRNMGEAEDVAQDAFLQVWAQRERWQDGGAKFGTWLYRVVVNRCIDHKRRPSTGSMEEAGEPADERPDAVAHIQRQQMTDRLRFAMSQLADQQQVALTLFYYEGMSNAQAADVMEISVTALESLLKRARQRLRELMRQSAGDVAATFSEV